jgi:hypothetical protein
VFGDDLWERAESRDPKRSHTRAASVGCLDHESADRGSPVERNGPHADLGSGDRSPQRAPWQKISPDFDLGAAGLLQAWGGEEHETLRVDTLGTPIRSTESRVPDRAWRPLTLLWKRGVDVHVASAVKAVGSRP